MNRKKKKVRNKRKAPTRKKVAPGTHDTSSAGTAEEGPVAEVIDLKEKRLEKVTEEIHAALDGLTRGIDERVALVVDAYRAWEEAKPKLRLRPYHKMSMVRLGFIGPGGFDRCHESHRLPESAFIDEDGMEGIELWDDNKGSKALMCPAMQDRRCQEIWRAMDAPPCQLLLLEVSRGLGGGADDQGLRVVLDDYGKIRPEARAKSFVRAERLVREYDEKAGW